MKRLLSFTGWGAGIPMGLMALLAGCAIPPPMECYVPPPPVYYPTYFEGTTVAGIERWPHVRYPIVIHQPGVVHVPGSIPPNARVVTVDGRDYWNYDVRYYRRYRHGYGHSHTHN